MSFYYNIPVIIDFHTHIFPPHIRENRDRYVNGDLCFAGLYSSEKAKLVTAEELIENMDREEIDMSVITNIGWTSHDLCVETNDYILESASKYPDRLHGLCTVNPNEGNAAVKEMERCITGGMKGLGEMRPDVQSLDLESSEIWDEIVRLMTENDLIFLTHASEPVGHLYQGKGETTPGMVYPFIVRYPELKIVLAHWGGGLPFYYLMPEVKKACENVYFDTAASPYLYTPDIYEHVVNLAGPDKVLFGSDYPLMKPGRLLKELDSRGFSDEIRQQIVAGNALRLLDVHESRTHG